MRYASDIGFIRVLIFLAGFAWRARGHVRQKFPRYFRGSLSHPAPSLPPPLSLSLPPSRDGITECDLDT